MARAGIPHAKQIKINNPLTPQQEAIISSWQMPVIVKPPNQACGVGVSRCDSIVELKAILAQQNLGNVFGRSIPYFVVQEFLQGEEYFIDTFSHHRQHL